MNSKLFEITIYITILVFSVSPIFLNVLRANKNTLKMSKFKRFHAESLGWTVASNTALDIEL